MLRTKVLLDTPSVTVVIHRVIPVSRTFAVVFLLLHRLKAEPEKKSNINFETLAIMPPFTKVTQ